MSVVTATVTPGYAFTPDATNKINVTKDRLNLLGVPVVTATITNSVALVDLTAAVKQLLPKVSITNADSTGGVGTSTIQVQDNDGNSISNEYVVHVWVSNTDLGEPHPMTTSFLPTTGVLISTLQANADTIVQSDANGKIVMSVQDGAGTVYVMASINGLVFSAVLDIT